MDQLFVIAKSLVIFLIIAIVLNYMAFISQEIERIRINTDKMVKEIVTKNANTTD